MRYIHFVESFSTGVFSWILDVASHQAKAGHEVIIVHSMRQETPQDYRDILPKNIRTIHFQMKREISPFSDLKSIYAFTKIINELKPNVLHLHSSKAGVIGRISSLLSFASPAVFYTPHGLGYLRQDVSEKKSVSIHRKTNELPTRSSLSLLKK